MSERDNQISVPFRVGRNAILIAAAVTVATVATAVIGNVRFAYQSAAVHVMIATAVALIGVLAAGLVLARFLRSHELQDWALTCALVIFSCTNLFLVAIPLAFDRLHTHFSGWVPFLGSVAGALV